MPIGNPKGTFYNNFEMQQRRDIPSEPFTMPPNIVNIQATSVPTPPSNNNSVIHNSYGSPQILLKSNQNNAKNRFNANAQDVYYNSGYFGKQPNPSAEYYGKYEVEFAAQQQKVALTNPMAPFNHQSKSESFGDTKPVADFHHPVKGETHHGIKPELLQQQHHKNTDFHPNKGPNFHLNHQNFYNHHAAAHNMNTEGAPHAHQNAIQYNSNQYFPAEYGSANDLESSPAYYDQKAASAHQNNYYENIYGGNSNHGAADYHGLNETPYPTPSNGQLPNEHCDNFLYPQYFEGNQHQNNTINQLTQPNHISHANSNAMHPNQHFNHGVGGPHYHVAQPHMNGNQHPAGSTMDSSNSSSDFNFLSNLTNDFAPEYYQLS